MKKIYPFLIIQCAMVIFFLVWSLAPTFSFYSELIKCFWASFGLWVGWFAFELED